MVMIRLYNDSLRDEYEPIIVNDHLFKVIDFHKNRFAIGYNEGSSVIGWIENKYDANLNSLIGRIIKFTEDELYVYSEDLLIETTFSNKNFKTLKDIEDKTTKEWALKYIHSSKEYKMFIDSFDVSNCFMNIN